MAILQQVALTLKEYGVRCAHLLMRHQCSAASTGISCLRLNLAVIDHEWEQSSLFASLHPVHNLCSAHPA